MEKKSTSRGNNASIINKALSKKIMKKSNLRNKHLKSRGEEDRQSYAKQRNLCIFKKDKKEFQFNFKRKNVIDNRKF